MRIIVNAPRRVWNRDLLHRLNRRLACGGVLILDDYGYWAGAREATDRFMAESGTQLLLNRIDVAGRIGVRP